MRRVIIEKYGETIAIPDPYGGELKYHNNSELWPKLFSYGYLYTYIIESLERYLLIKRIHKKILI